MLAAAQATAPNAILATCPHFADCGGCTDLSPKDDRLPTALQAAGFPNPPVAPLATSPPNTRRRMDLAVRRTAAGVELGLHRHRSHDIVDLHTCLVLHPDLVALFDPLRQTLNRLDLLRRSASAIANRLDNGIDLLLRTDAPATTADRAKLAAFAAANGIARISAAIGNAPPEPVATLRPPRITLSGIDVAPPPGAFLQATVAGEHAIRAAVLAGLPKLKPRARLAELYAGIGTLTFALAQHACVTAYEGDAPALAALQSACAANGLLGRIDPHHRDLTRQPLQPRDLAPYAALILDPPAAGTGPQLREIAAAAIPRIIYVSCDPATLTREAATLRAAGYALLAATPIDQFIGTSRIESVCVFTRTP